MILSVLILPFHSFLSGAPNDETLQTIDKIKLFIKDSIEVAWSFMELHVKKFILFLIMVICISEVRKIVLLRFWRMRANIIFDSFRFAG